MGELPAGVVTFLVTDIEGATRLAQRLGDETYAAVLSEHRELLRAAVFAYGGVEVRTEGDGCIFVFSRASEALAAAVQAQEGLAGHGWPEDRDVRVRMGIHTGEVTVTGADYDGRVVHEVEQVAAAGHGGQVLVTASACLLVAAPPEGTALRSLGAHRLAELDEVIELFQLEAAGQASSFPPLRSLARTVHNLPVQASSFLGRDRDLAEGARHLADHRLVTVVGPGGIGKTRVAFQLAARSLDAFADGVWVVTLAGLGDPTLVAGALAGALGLPDATAGGPVDAAVRHLGGQRALVVLDNCEHVIDAAAELTDALLDGCPGVHVLATSRQPLRLDGEFVWALGPLGLPEGDDAVVEEAAASDGVRLFVERATQAGGELHLDAGSVGSVLTICRRLDGMPLAIELAAARAPSLSTDQIAERLERSLDLLSKGHRTATDRQSTLRGAIAWSERLLDEDERRLFARLAVFRGVFNFEDAVAVCAEPGQTEDEVLLALAELVDKSLVVAHPGDRRTRYSMLQTIADFAAERLDERGERADMRERHLRHFIKVMDDGVDEIMDAGAVELGPVLENLEARLDNNRAALAAALEHDDPDVALDLGSSTARFWERKSNFREGRRWLEAALARGGSPLARCQGLLASAAMANRMSDNPAAVPQLEEANALAIELGLDGVAMHTASELGSAALEEGRVADADTWYERYAELARALGATDELAGATLNRGFVQLEMGNLDAAEAMIREALAAARHIDTPRLLCSCLLGVGTVDIYKNDLAEARLLLEEAAELTKLSGDEFVTGLVGNNLAEIAWREGRDSEALAYFEEGLAWARASGAVRVITFLLGGLAGFMARRGDAEDAAMLHGAAAGTNEAANIFLDPFQAAGVEEQRQALEATLGPEMMARLTAEGRRLGADEALRRAQAWVQAQSAANR